MSKGKYHNWKVVRDDQEICWLHLDKKDSSANVLSADILDELDKITTEIAHGIF